MVEQHYRWDFIGLSTDTKPTPETSEKVVDGSTFYCSDTSKLYVYCKNNWYEKTVSGGGGTSYTAGTGIDITGNKISVDTNTIQPKLTAGTGIDITDNTISATGGGGPTVVQTTGTSTTDVMSQNATTSMIFADPATGKRVRIGTNQVVGSYETVSVGDGAQAYDSYSVAIGSARGYSEGDIIIGASANHLHFNAPNCVAIGRGSTIGNYKSCVALGYKSGFNINANGMVDIGLRSTSKDGYSNSHYRVLTGLYDGQGLHDAATVAQGNTLASSAPTTTTVGVLGQLYTDTTNMHTYQCTAIDTTDPDNPAYTWTQRW